MISRPIGLSEWKKPFGPDFNPIAVDVLESSYSQGGGPRWPHERKMADISAVQFSKFFFVVKACENRHLFLFHKQLPIIHRLAARRRQSDEGLSRQFFRAKNPKFSILSYKHVIYLK